MSYKEKGNVLLVSNYSSDTGYAWWLMEHFWKLISETVDASGREIFLAFPRINGLSEVVRDSPIKAVELKVFWANAIEKKSIQDFIKDKNIKSVYFTDQNFFDPVFCMLRLWGVNKIVVHDHTPGDREAVNGIRGLVKSWRNRLPFFTANCVFCVSERMKIRSQINGRIPEDRIAVIQNGIEPIQVDKLSASVKRAELGISNQTFLVISTGRAHPYKRFDFIIKCAALLNNTHPELDILFLLVGDGPAMGQLSRAVEKLELQETVRLLGFREDIHGLLVASDMAFHAALGEGFSLSILEYMSARLPVLVPDIPSVNQAIDDQVTGFIYSRDNCEEVVGLISRLAAQPALRLRMGEEARRVASERYSLDNCSETFRINVNKFLL